MSGAQDPKDRHYLKPAISTERAAENKITDTKVVKILVYGSVEIQRFDTFYYYGHKKEKRGSQSQEAGSRFVLSLFSIPELILFS